MRCRIVKAYRGKCNVVHLLLRCEDGSRRLATVTGYRPYFYAPSRLGSHKAIDGSTVERIEVRCPEDVPVERERYQRHYEADIPFARRVLIDLGLMDGVELDRFGEVDYRLLRPAHASNIPLNLWYIDIEVYAERFPEPSRAEYPVIAITLSNGEKYYTLFWHRSLRRSIRKTGRVSITACGESVGRVAWELRGFPDEEQMLLEFITLLTSIAPDYLIGWNVGFDVGYLKMRMRSMGMDLPGDFVPFDLLEGFRWVGPRQRSYRLKEVTVSERIECREDAVEAADVLKTWEEDPRELLRYNLRDVWRIVEIDRRYRVSDYFISLRDVTGIESISRWSHDRPWEVYPVSTLPLVDTLVLREARRRNVVLPSSGNASRSTVKGAIVLEPVPGIHEGVAVLDMSRYYPSLIISFNISPETKLRPVDPANGIWAFREEPEGLLPAAIRGLLDLRERLEAELQQYKPGTPEYEAIENKIMAVKGVVNSFYGVTANPHFRLFDPDVANTITGLAREGILYVVEQARELGYQPLYGDTDSIFIRVPFEEAEDLSRELTARLRRYFREKYGLKKEPVLKLKFEKYYSRIFFKPRTKKRYVGLLVWKKGQKVDPPKLDVAGFEAVRTDVAPFTSYAQVEVFKAILEGRSRREIVDIVNRLAREARERSLNEVALFEGLAKDPSEYRVKQPHVRAALYANLYLGASFTKGSKVRYVWVRRVKCPGLPPTDVVGFDSDLEPKVSECFEVDWNRQLEAILYGPLKEVLEVVGIRVSAGVRLHTFF